MLHFKMWIPDVL